MDHHALSNLLLRVAGVIIVVSSVLSVPPTVIGLATNDSSSGNLTSAVLMSGLAALLPLLVGLVLLWFPGTVTHRIVGVRHEEASAVADGEKLRQLAFSVLGLYFVSSALFDAVYWYARLKLYHSTVAAEFAYMMPPVVLQDDFAGMLSTGSQLIVGLLLLFGSKGISNLVAKVRG